MAVGDQIEVHGDVVTKLHGDADGEQRAAISALAMTAAHTAGLPVPEVMLRQGRHLQTRAVAGVSGIMLLERSPETLLGHIGRFARALHQLPVPAGLPVDDPTGVWIHGDLCPINLHVTDDGTALAGVLDWEDSRVGDPVEDLAWTEWLVRSLHTTLVPRLRTMFEAYGATPSPDARLGAMVRMIDRHLDRAEDERERSVWRLRLSMLHDLDLSSFEV